jgi:hypothetical protein
MKLNTTTQQTTDTISERGKFIRIGILPIYARPLTLLQVEEIGEVVEGMSEIKDTDPVITSEVFKRVEGAKALGEVLVISLFRSRIMRLLLGGYVKKRLDSDTIKKCVAHMKDTFDFAFFFTATVFLRGMKRTKEERDEATALGG